MDKDNLPTVDEIEKLERSLRKSMEERPDDPAPYLELANLYRTLSRPSEAETLYERVCERNPENPDVLFELGRFLYEKDVKSIKDGEVFEPYRFSFPLGAYAVPAHSHFPASNKPRAVDLLRQCLALKADHGSAQSILGLILIDAPNTLREGIDLINSGIRAAPDFAMAHFAVGRLALGAGAFPVAAAAFGHTLTQPNQVSEDAPAWCHLAKFINGELSISDLLAGDDHTRQVALARGLVIVAANPQLADDVRSRVKPLESELAARLVETAIEAINIDKAFIKAAECLHWANELDPGHADAPVALGLIMFSNGDFEFAEAALEQAFESGTAHPFARYLLDMTRVVLGKPPKTPGFEDTLAYNDLYDIALIFCYRTDFASAEVWYRRAIDAKPGDAKSLVDLSQMVSIQGRLDEALELANEALALAPDNRQVRYRLSGLFMGLGRLEEAWPLYEERLYSYMSLTPRSEPPIPRWDGEDLTGKTLFVWREEGLGDELLCASYLPDFAAKFPGGYVFECTPRLTTLFRRSLPGIHVRTEDLDDEDFSKFDYHLPAGSMPLYVRKTLADFGDGQPYLKPDPERVTYWRQRLDQMDDKPKVGLGWYSLNQNWTKRHLHSKLDDMFPLLSNPDLTFINLQIGDVAEEVSAMNAARGFNFQILDGLDVKNDMEEVSALMAALDAVVSARCWVITMAGFVGTKGYCYSCHPNFLMFGQDYSPYAPKTEVYYKQDYRESWGEPVTAIAESLKRHFRP